MLATKEATFTDNINVYKISNFGETANFNSDINVIGISNFDGTANFNSNINVAGTSFFGETADFNSDVNINGVSNFTGIVNFNDIIVNGYSYFYDNVNLEKDLDMGQSGIASFYNLPVCPQIPTEYNQLINKLYVDSIIAGIKPKESVKIATTVNITSLSGIQTIDGYLGSDGDRILVKDQGNTGQTGYAGSVDNGIYIMRVGDWPRSSDFDVGYTGFGSFMFVQKGVTNSNHVFIEYLEPGVVGTDPLYFTLFSNIFFNIGQGLEYVYEDTLQVKSNLDFVDNVGTTNIPNLLLGSRDLKTTILSNLNVTANLGVTGNTYLKGTLGVTGNTLLYGTLGVTGNTYLNNTLRVGEATNLNSTLGVNGNGIFNNNLNVNGNFGVTGNTFLNGILGVTGNSIFNNNLNVNGNFGVTGNTFLNGTLGVTGNTLLYGTLGVTGSTYLNSTLGVNGNGIFNNNLNINGNFGVTGSGTIGKTASFGGGGTGFTTFIGWGGGGNITANSVPALSVGDGFFDNNPSYGTVNITRPYNDFTRAHIACIRQANWVWQQGFVVDNQETNPTFTNDYGFFNWNYNKLRDGWGLARGVPLLRLNRLYGVIINGTLGVTGNTTLIGTLGVGAATNLNSTLTVGGATNLNSTLGVTGNTFLNGTLGVTGNTTLIGTLGVGAATNLNSTLTVGGATNLNSTLGVTGNTFLNGTLGVTGNTTLIGTLTVGGATNLSGSLAVSTTLAVTQTSTFGQTANFNSNLAVNGNTILNGTLGVTGNTTLNNLTVTGTTNLRATTITGTCTATEFRIQSDYRIKDNIENLDNKYNIDNLRPVTYNNKLINNKDIGLIAHEVQEFYPYLVSGKKDGENIQNINYIGLIPILIKEIQDLKSELKIIKNYISNLN